MGSTGQHNKANGQTNIHNLLKRCHVKKYGARVHFKLLQSITDKRTFKIKVDNREF